MHVTPMPLPDTLSPPLLWRHFALLCALPRPSRHEGRVMDYLCHWANTRQLAWRMDQGGNLLICKPATPGMEQRETVVLQGHVDMVCQQDSDGQHDFFNEPIRPYLGDDGWVRAQGTTLGADNGIGIAAMLAVLDSQDIPHPAIEALFTVNEEAGMDGAHDLATDLLSGRLLLNLDTEDWGEFYIGCAGGEDVSLRRQCEREPTPEGHGVWQLALRGLRGGHSGVDIHRHRSNATRLLARLLLSVAGRCQLRLGQLTGGTLRNVIPRESSAIFALPDDKLAELRQAMADWQDAWRADLAECDHDLTLSLIPASLTTVLSLHDQSVVLDLLNALPDGMACLSPAVPGVVETSSNLGVVGLDNGRFHAVSMVRSLTEDGLESRVTALLACGRLAGCSGVREGSYPGWTPRPDSPLLALASQVFTRMHGQAPQVKVIHAGLECGILLGKYPNLDVLSFGPDIRGAHSPDEQVNVASVAAFWQFLCALLAETPLREPVV